MTLRLNLLLSLQKGLYVFLCEHSFLSNIKSICFPWPSIGAKHKFLQFDKKQVSKPSLFVFCMIPSLFFLSWCLIIMTSTNSIYICIVAGRFILMLGATHIFSQEFHIYINFYCKTGYFILLSYLLRSVTSKLELCCNQVQIGRAHV